jgi:hypothetical protein
MSMTLVQSDQKAFKFFVLVWRNPWQDMWYNGSLLKVREEKHKREYVGCGWSLTEREHAFLSLVLLKLTIFYGKGGTR